MNIFDQVTQA